MGADLPSEADPAANILMQGDPREHGLKSWEMREPGKGRAWKESFIQTFLL